MLKFPTSGTNVFRLPPLVFVIHYEWSPGLSMRCILCILLFRHLFMLFAKGEKQIKAVVQRRYSFWKSGPCCAEILPLFQQHRKTSKI